jgi:hypothetical protein
MADNPYSHLTNQSQIEAFADMDSFLRRQGAGALGGDGVEAFLTPEVRPTPSGISIGTKCESGDCSIQVDVTWPELVFIANQVAPPQWYYFQGHLRPHVGCPRCGKEVQVGLTPEECQKYVKSGIQAGRVSPQQVQQVAQAAQQQAMAQQGMGRR